MNKRYQSTQLLQKEFHELKTLYFVGPSPLYIYIPPNLLRV